MSSTASTSTTRTIMHPPVQHAAAHAHAHAHEADDPYDAGKESPLVDTLVEGAVVLVIAALINVTLWGLIHFSDDLAVLNSSPTAIR